MDLYAFRRIRPLNTVPKAMVDEHLNKNPVMRKAREKSGYKMGRG